MVEVHDLSFKEVREQLCSDRHPDFGNEIIKSLVSGEPLLETLRGLCDVSPYGTTGTVAIKSYLQISQNRELMVPVPFQFVGL